ncbi:L-asparaginase [Mycobacteroides salmoniphilum]|nr:L-asparaginase [Mycobacteroides salmoniphilum]
MIAAVPDVRRPKASSPTLVLLTTGGTIATAVGSDGIARHRSSGNDLLAASGYGDVAVHDVMAIDSAEMTPQHWQQIAAALRGHIASGATGVVIAHGTDTLEETALWLALTCAVPVPVVLTGAQRSGDHPESDGPGNLRDALTVAASGEALGVVVCFAGQVYPALGIRKVDLATPAGFAGVAPIGDVRDGVFVRSGDAPSPFLGTVTRAALPRVDIVSLYPGADAVALESYVRAGAQGLVLESMGAGNANDVVIESVSRQIEDGTQVLVTTRVPGGELAPGYAPGQKLIDAGGVMVPRLRSGQARVLLMAVLATGSDLVSVINRLG